MGPYGLTRKQTDFLLRLYLDRCDNEDLYWYWDEKNRICVVHEKRWLTVEIYMIIDFFFKI